MDPVGAAVALVLAASAFYRTIAGKREALTAGLWAAAFGLAISAPVVTVDAALKASPDLTVSRNSSATPLWSLAAI
jgi:hypothetical protein